MWAKTLSGDREAENPKQKLSVSQVIPETRALPHMFVLWLWCELL